MRIWSLHPSLLDRAGLVACWRETLLAQAVLASRTKGYRQHPQLLRFRECPEPLGAITAYLGALADEADARGYRFDRSRIDEVPRWEGTMPVTDGQLNYEFAHLRAKVAARAPERLPDLDAVSAAPTPHPLFTVVTGPVAAWERV